MAVKRIKLKNLEVDGNVLLGGSAKVKLKKLIRELEREIDAAKHANRQKKSVSEIEQPGHNDTGNATFEKRDVDPPTE